MSEEKNTPGARGAAAPEKAAESAKEQGAERPKPKRRGRKPSPRTGQVHAKVMPNVAREISREAVLRGVQQGVLIEEAWALYKARRDAED